MEKIKRIFLDDVDSTNTYLSNYKGKEEEYMTIAQAEFQTQGKGQGENSWESERGKNLLFSIKVKPKNIPSNRGFVLLEAKSLAILDALKELISDVSIKWPNDIYYKDKKLSGTLSECKISGNKVTSAILGTGINVNQSTFLSDAKNPISLYLILGKEVDKDSLLERIILNFKSYLEIISSGDFSKIDNLYFKSLYRREGFHFFEDKTGKFKARILSVKPTGEIILEKEDKKQKVYEFKSLKFIID